MLMAVTLIVPPVLPVVTLIVFVVELPDHPEGKVHAYEVAPATGMMVYVCDVPVHGEAAPEIFPGCNGKLFPFG